MGTAYQQATIPIVDPTRYFAVRERIAASFSATGVAEFLRALDRDRIRVREFEQVIERGLLGSDIAAEYTQLSNADQGQIREFYLASLEQVPSDLRSRFYKLYAYY